MSRTVERVLHRRHPDQSPAQVLAFSDGVPSQVGASSPVSSVGGGRWLTSTRCSSSGSLVARSRSRSASASGDGMREPRRCPRAGFGARSSKAGPVADGHLVRSAPEASRPLPRRAGTGHPLDCRDAPRADVTGRASLCRRHGRRSADRPGRGPGSPRHPLAAHPGQPAARPPWAVRRGVRAAAVRTLEAVSKRSGDADIRLDELIEDRPQSGRRSRACARLAARPGTVGGDRQPCSRPGDRRRASRGWAPSASAMRCRSGRPRASRPVGGVRRARSGRWRRRATVGRR